MSLRQQALSRAITYVTIASDATTPPTAAASFALRGVRLIHDHRFLQLAGEGLELETACRALVMLAGSLVTGCEHADQHRVCGACARRAHVAIVAARSVLSGVRTSAEQASRKEWE